MALHNKSKEIALFDCNGTELTPMQSVDLTQYDKLSGKGNNPSVGPTISGATVSYDLSSWTTFPEAWSEGCGVWYVNGADMYVGQGTGCTNLWNGIADVVAMMNSLDPNGLTWTLSGTTVSATSAAIDPNTVAYQVAACSDIPTFVDCNGDALEPLAGGTVSDSVVLTSSYTGTNYTSTKLADVSAGVFDFKTTFTNATDATNLYNALLTLDSDPYGWGHETITPPGISVDWPHGSFTNISLVGNEVFYRIDLNMTAITPTPPTPYSANPAGSDFTSNKALLDTAYQSLTLNVPVPGSDFTFDLHTQVLSGGATGTVYQVATCADIPAFVDCDGNPLTPIGATSIYSVLSKIAPNGYTGFGAPWSLATHVADVTAGTHSGWFMYEWCFAPGAAPAQDPNGHTIHNTPYTSNPDLVANDVLTVTGNASPTCASGTQPTYEVATCADIDGLQTQIDALAASEKYVASGVILNPNTPNATLELTLNDGSTVTIDVSTLEDTITAAQIIALFPNGANISVAPSGTSVRFLGQDGQWHTLVIPATTHTLASTANSMTSTVDGVSASATIVNSNALSLAGATLTSTVNGVVSSGLNLAPAIAAATTHTLTSATNTMTSTVNGVVASAPIVNSNTLTKPTANTLQSTVNGVASGSVAIIASTALTQNATGQLVDTVNGIASAPLTILASTTPLADGVGDTRTGAIGASLLAARADHIHPITAIVTPPAFTDLLLSGNMTSAGAYSSSGVVTTEETVTYKGQKPVTANTGTWSIVNPPALAGYTLESFEGSPYSPSGMDTAAGVAGGGSRDFNWQYVTYYDNVRRNNLAHNLSTKAVYKLN